MDEYSGRWVSVRDAALHVGLSTDSIYHAVARRELRHTRVGGRRVIKFQIAWLDEWLERSAQAPQERVMREVLVMERA
jgi:excisionase family DNA binding protein